MITEESWTDLAIEQLRRRFIQDDEFHFTATFDSGDYHVLLHEDKREWYTFLIAQEGYGE